MNKQDIYIIHVTKKFEYLESILSTSSIRLSYCGEIFNVGTKRVSSAAHPMVCFSEYCISELPNKNVTYGEYGVAFTKEWAEKNSLNPVLYVEKTSQVAQGLSKLLEARQGKIKSMFFPFQLRMPVIQLKCFTKNVRGYNSHFDVDDFDFKTENEWRYVPTKKKIGGNLISQNYSTYDKNREEHNRKLLDYPLPFNIDDLQCVFVSNKEEKKLLENKFSKKSFPIVVKPWNYIIK